MHIKNPQNLITHERSEKALSTNSAALISPPVTDSPLMLRPSVRKINNYLQQLVTMKIYLFHYSNLSYDINFLELIYLENHKIQK